MGGGNLCARKPNEIYICAPLEDFVPLFLQNYVLVYLSISKDRLSFRRISLCFITKYIFITFTSYKIIFYKSLPGTNTF